MSNVYAEYKTNLYTRAAMGCVTNSDASNVYADSIPIAAVAERFAAETVEWLPSGYQTPSGEWIADESNVTAVRKRDGKVHARFNADSGLTRRQSAWLVDLATGVTRESRGDILVTGAGTTRNGGRAYLQFSTANISSVAGMDYAPFVTLGIGQDGSLGTVSSRGSLIIACANQIAGLFGAAKATGARVKQTKNRTDASIITAHMIGLDLVAETDEMDTALKAMAETAFTAAHWTKLLDDIAPVNVENASKNAETRNENARELLTGMWNADSRVIVAPEFTVLRAVQTLNTFDIWERGTRGDTDAQTRQTDDFLSGALVKRENARGEQIARVLATV